MAINISVQSVITVGFSPTLYCQPKVGNPFKYHVDTLCLQYIKQYIIPKVGNPFKYHVETLSL